MNSFNLITPLGGLAMFLYGMRKKLTSTPVRLLTESGIRDHRHRLQHRRQAGRQTGIDAIARAIPRAQASGSQLCIPAPFRP